MTDMAKPFRSEGEQAVRLPGDHPFTTAEVGVRREGRKLVPEPIDDEQAWPDDVGSCSDASPAGSGEKPRSESK